MGKKSTTGFWIKNIVIIVAVIVGATSFLIYGPKPPQNDSNSSSANGEKEENSVAAGVTRFYAEFRQSSRDPIAEIFGDDTIILEDHNKITVESKVEQMPDSRYAAVSQWDGAYRERAFKRGSTVMTELKQYAKEEGVNFLWDLNQDFKIRNRFLSTSTFVGTLEEIASAIDSHYNNPINVYYCEQKAVIIFTERESSFLKLNCQKSQGSFQNY